MKRGEIWSLRDKHYASKARPVVIVRVPGLRWLPARPPDNAEHEICGNLATDGRAHPISALSTLFEMFPPLCKAHFPDSSLSVLAIMFGKS